MPTEDRYSNIADYYDYMLRPNPEREKFFRGVFQQHKVRNILDCACGTGQDLLLFSSLGYNVVGSDISESMLKVAHEKMAENQVSVTLQQADFHDLKRSYDDKFDAVVCLSNAVNEIDVDVIRALESMNSVLNRNGLIVFDQGQTDFTMQNPPTYFPEVNDQDLSRLYTMNYTKDIMTVNIYDFIHKADDGFYDFKHSVFNIRIRLYSEWLKILHQVGLEADIYGSWTFEPYDILKSKRLIVVARKSDG